MNPHPRELIGAYADGELPPDRAAAVEAHLRDCTECARELALIRDLGGAMRATMERRRESVWGGVHRRITTPTGWILLVAGAVVLGTLALLEWYRERTLTLEWLATTSIGIGLALLVVGIGHRQYREWKTTRYKDVLR